MRLQRVQHLSEQQGQRAAAPVHQTRPPRPAPVHVRAPADILGMNFAASNARTCGRLNRNVWCRSSSPPPPAPRAWMVWQAGTGRDGGTAETGSQVRRCQAFLA